MTVDFSVVLITEKGQNSLVYLLYCMLPYTKMISFSTASLLEETGNISIESFQKRISSCKGQREGGEKKLSMMIHHCKGSICNFLSLLSSTGLDRGWSVLSFKFWVVKLPHHGRSTPACWQRAFLSKETPETRPGQWFWMETPILRGLGFAGGRWFIEFYSSWEIGYVLNQTGMGQRDSAGHRLNFMLIQLLQSTTWSPKGRRTGNRLEMEGPAGKRALLDT